jgi:CelD/BcsL family acetyltransferase involved in cellulose biosynthesis
MTDSVAGASTSTGSATATSLDGQHGLVAYNVLDLSFCDLSGADIEGWRALELRTLEPNIYLTYDYIKPLSRHLIPERDIRIIIVTSTTAEGVECRAVLPVVQRRGFARFPFPHYAGIHSIYSLLGGMLIDREHSEPAAQQLFRYLRSRSWRWFGVRFVNLSLNSEQGLIVARAARLAGFRWWENSRQRRPWLRITADRGGNFLSHLSRNRAKTVQRRRRQLSKLGSIHWRSVSGQGITPEHIDRFLDLEHRGWKGSGGTSLRSRTEHEQFFVDVVRSLRESDRVFFNELLIEDTVVSSTANYRLGEAGFAFKIGWDPRYAKYSIGTLNEISFMEDLSSGGWRLAYVDSGAEEDSYLGSLWPDHEIVGNGIYVSNPVASAFLFAVRVCRNVMKPVIHYIKRERQVST